MKQSSYQQRKLALVQEIIGAFEGVARGNGVTLHEALVIDDSVAFTTTPSYNDKKSPIPSVTYKLKSAMILGWLIPFETK